MKAYKAFNRDMTCSGFQYVEGEVYELEGKPILCERGFHFCKDLVLTLTYYPVESITDNRYAEVEVLGDVEFEEPTRHKGVTNKIKVIRVIPDEEVASMVDSKNNNGNWNSGDKNNGHRNSGDENFGEGNSGHRNSGNRNSGNGNSGFSNSGHENSGYSNIGNGNSGSGNRGNGNSGSGNSGEENSGHKNSGQGNSGHSNSGDENSGNWNSGNGNSGHRNSGNGGSGDWNSCDKESGCFNTEQLETIRIFNKPCPIEEWENAYKPIFLYFAPRDGDYKASFVASWESADKEDREKVRKLPNFNADVFYELSGIDLRG